ncbi:Glycerophosphoryl diester phosphodiesterase family [Aciduliprofundum boonei T469]|nr:Glycerophosphoryl diester phosphodiesterase family [Aciduliprofundum boonei T469]
MSRWDKKWIILGHRGFRSNFPENTLKSFGEAIKAGADGIELDVWLSSDGYAIISHDEDLERVSGVHMKIKDSKLEDIKSLNIGEGERVPTLDEVFSTLPENALINIEIKDVDAVEKSIGIVRKWRAEDRVMFSSFNIDALREIRKKDEDAIIGVLIEKKETIPMIPQINKELKLFSVNLPIDAIEIFSFEEFKNTILWLKGIGLKIVLWADKDEIYYLNGNIDKLKDLVDIVITDNVVKMREHLSKD